MRGEMGAPAGAFGKGQSRSGTRSCLGREGASGKEGARRAQPTSAGAPQRRWAWAGWGAGEELARGAEEGSVWLRTGFILKAREHRSFLAGVRLP